MGDVERYGVRDKPRGHTRMHRSLADGRHVSEPMSSTSRPASIVSSVRFQPTENIHFTSNSEVFTTTGRWVSPRRDVEMEHRQWGRSRQWKSLKSSSAPDSGGWGRKMMRGL